MISVLVTLGIAATVALISFLQWRTNQATLREKLFERRFAIFKETQYFLTVISQHGEISGQLLEEFRDTAQRSRFLFGSRVSQDLNQILLKGRRLALLQSRLSNHVTESAEWENAQDEIQLIGDFMDKKFLGVFDYFEKYMDFSKSI